MSYPTWNITTLAFHEVKDLTEVNDELNRIRSQQNEIAEALNSVRPLLYDLYYGGYDRIANMVELMEKMKNDA